MAADFVKRQAHGFLFPVNCLGIELNSQKAFSQPEQSEKHLQKHTPNRACWKPPVQAAGFFAMAACAAANRAMGTRKGEQLT
jgi:hypothetical protein